MRIHNLYCDADGQSHFREIAVDLTEPWLGGLLSKPQSVTAIIFRELPSGAVLDWHNAPRRQYVISAAIGTKLKCSFALHYDRYQTNCRLSHRLFARPGGRTSGALGNPCSRTASYRRSGCRCKHRGRPGRSTARSRAERTGGRSAETLD
jgi:hypothetical protein